MTEHLFACQRETFPKSKRVPSHKTTSLEFRLEGLDQWLYGLGEYLARLAPGLENGGGGRRWAVSQVFLVERGVEGGSHAAPECPNLVGWVLESQLNVRVGRCFAPKLVSTDGRESSCKTFHVPKQRNKTCRGPTFHSHAGTDISRPPFFILPFVLMLGNFSGIWRYHGIQSLERKAAL